MITGEERESALDLLVRSRKVLLEAVEGVTEEQARWKPAADRWCILEYVEHLALAEDALVALVQRNLRTLPHLETDEERREREKRIRETHVPRGVIRAPADMTPDGRFTSLKDAVSAFLAARERTLEYTRTTQEDIRRHFSLHQVLGPLDGYQWLLGNGRHAEKHAGHIVEIRSSEGFPPGSTATVSASEA